MSSPPSSACAICLRSTQRTKIGVPESCAHEFCFSCILEWSKNINTCPIDRGKFNTIYVYEGGRRTSQVLVPDRQFDEFSIVQEEYVVACEVCRLSDREDRLLLCDGCDLGYHLECLTPPLHSVPPGNWYCPTCGPILGIFPEQQTASQSSNAELLVDSEEEAVCTEHYNLRPRHTSGEGAGPSGHAYLLRSSTTAGHTAAGKEQRRSECVSLDSSGDVYFDSATVTVTVSNSGSDVHLNKADVAFTASDSDTNEALQQQSTRRRRLQSARMICSSDEDTMLNVASGESESDGVCVRRKRNRRRKLPATLKTSESESEGEVEGYASGTGVAEWFSAGEDGCSSEQSCESEASGWDVRKGKGPCGPQENSEDGGSFNDASTISIHSGCGVASGSDVTGKGESPYSPLVVEDKGDRATRKSRSKGKARLHPQRSCRKRRKLTAESGRRLSQGRKRRQVKRRTLKRKARKRVAMPIQPAKRRLVAGEPSGINSAGTVVSIPETPLAKRRLTHGSSHTYSTPTLTPQARVVASTPTSSLRQVRVQQAVREYATTGSLPQKSEMASEDRMIEWWVQRKHSSPSWIREAVDRKKAAQVTKETSPSWSGKSRETPSSTKLSLGTPNRRHWKQAELRLPQINRRPLLGAQRPDAPRPQTSVNMLGIMDCMDLLHQSNKVTVKRDGSVVPLGEGEGPSHHYR